MKLEGQDYSKPPVPEPYVHLLNAYGSLVNFLVPLFCYRLFFAVSCRYSCSEGTRGAALWAPMSIKRDRRPIAELKVMTCPPFNSGALLTYGRKTFYYRINAYVYFSEECKLHTIRLERAFVISLHPQLSMLVEWSDRNKLSPLSIYTFLCFILVSSWFKCFLRKHRTLSRPSWAALWAPMS